MEANFQLVFNAIKRNIYEYGFMEINEDFLKTKNLSTISICEEGKETTDDISISTALLTMYDNEATDWTTIPPGLELQLIMLPEDFFEWCQHKHTLYHTDCEAANQVSQLFMTTCFSVPNTTKLSLEEMMLAHRTFTSGLSPWRTAADHWVKTGIENETGMVGSYFANVQMHNKSAQQTIDNNMVMEHAKRSHPTGEHVEIMLGLVPFTVMIDFYRDMKVIQDNTWQKLKEVLAKDDKLHGRYPVMGARFNGEKYFKIYELSKEEVLETLSPKKFLSVD